MEDKKFFRLGMASMVGFWFMIYVLFNWVFPLTTIPASALFQILVGLLLIACVLLTFCCLAVAMFCIVALEPDGGSVI